MDIDQCQLVAKSWRYLAQFDYSHDHRAYVSICAPNANKKSVKGKKCSVFSSQPIHHQQNPNTSQVFYYSLTQNPTNKLQSQIHPSKVSCVWCVCTINHHPSLTQPNAFQPG